MIARNFPALGHAPRALNECEQMSKKTDTIEIRVSPELKEKIVDLSRDEGTTMSGYLRELVAQRAEGCFQNPTGDPDMNMKSFTRPLLASLPLAALAAVYLSASGGVATATPEIRMAFAEMDLNADGVVTVAEYTSLLSQDLKMMEDMHDAQIPAVCENEPGFDMEVVVDGDVSQMAKDLVAELDSNGDATVSYDELHATMMRERAEDFLMYDANKNGLVSFKEFLSPGDVEEHEDEAFLGVSAECVAAMDAFFPDHQMAESEIEVETHIEFAAFDSDRNGQLTLAEYLAH